MGDTNFIGLSDMELTRFLFAIVLLLSAAHLFGYIFQRVKLPRVIGEIIGGVILGPSFFGFFLPDIFEWVFVAFDSEGKLISSFYWLGLVLLMFISGFETQRSLNKHDKKIIGVLTTATIIPFLAGWYITPQIYDLSVFIGVKQNVLALKMVISIAIAVTSIPVISRIFIDLEVLDTRFAKIVLATATIHDIILWVALAVATGMVKQESVSTISIISTVLITLAFFLIALLIMPRIVNFATHSRLNLLFKSSHDGYALFLCLLFAAVASILDVNIVFGALLAGFVLGTLEDERIEAVKSSIKRFSLAFFIPIYFAAVGLKIDLIHSFDIMLFIGFLLFSSFFQISGIFATAKLLNFDHLSSLNLAVAMNARGGPGIVLATVAYDMGIINEVFFVSLVVIAIVTSLFAGWWFRNLLTKGYHLLR